jgi:site-specific DNA recombinase
MMPYKSVLGFRKGENGLPEIVPEEAKIVRYIYRLFMKGMTPYGIARRLEEDNILSPTGKEKWYSSTVASILQNEKYRGSALLQKKYTVDFLTKKQKMNEGEIQQYYIEDSHPAIIEPEEFDLVQAEYARRENLETYYRNSTPYANSSVATVVPSTARRSGIPTRNTSEPSGNAMTSSRTRKSAVRRIFTNRRFKNPSSEH